MINLNSPIHNDWQLLIDDDTALKLMTPQLKRIYHKQHSNRVYTWDYLTPSFIQAYPNYKTRKKPFPLARTIPQQRQLLINHNTRELITL